jgi:KaiC/GvpD/RAD55 family RecA-like ATPase
VTCKTNYDGDKAVARPVAESPWAGQFVSDDGTPLDMDAAAAAGGPGYTGGAPYATGGYSDGTVVSDPALLGVATRDEDDEPAIPIRKPKAKLLSDAKATVLEHLTSGFAPFDEVTNGGSIVGTLAAWTSFPGVGKSTFLLEALAAYAGKGHKVAYASSEEPDGDIRLRCDRLDLYKRYPGSRKNLVIIAAESLDDDATDEEVHEAQEHGKAIRDVAGVIETADDEAIEILVIDSASRMESESIEGPQGAERQLAHVAKKAYKRAHSIEEYRGRPKMMIMVILHSTKEGDAAVPQSFIHDVDSTFVGEHLELVVREHRPPTVQIAKDQKKPSGLIQFRSHGKNRAGDVTLRTMLHMTGKDHETPGRLFHVENEDEAVELLRDLALRQRGVPVVVTEEDRAQITERMRAAGRSVREVDLRDGDSALVEDERRSEPRAAARGGQLRQDQEFIRLAGDEEPSTEHDLAEREPEDEPLPVKRARSVDASPPPKKAGKTKHKTRRNALREKARRR